MTTLVDIIRTWWPMFCFVQDKMTASTDRGMQIRPWEVSWLPFHNCPLANISAIKNMSFLDKLDTISHLKLTVNHEWHSNKSYVTLFDGLSLVTDIDHSSRRDELSYLHTMTLWHNNDRVAGETNIDMTSCCRGGARAGYRDVRLAPDRHLLVRRDRHPALLPLRLLQGKPAWLIQTALEFSRTFFVAKLYLLFQ